MIRKYHTHTLQTKLWHREKESQNTYGHKTQEDNQSKVTSSIFPIKMTVKLERTLRTKQGSPKTPTDNWDNKIQ